MDNQRCGKENLKKRKCKPKPKTKPKPNCKSQIDTNHVFAGFCKIQSRHHMRRTIATNTMVPTSSCDGCRSVSSIRFFNTFTYTRPRPKPANEVGTRVPNECVTHLHAFAKSIALQSIDRKERRAACCNGNAPNGALLTRGHKKAQKKKKLTKRCDFGTGDRNPPFGRKTNAAA